MGSPEFSVPTLRTLHEQHEVVAVYAQPPRKAGRGQKRTPTPVHRVAQDIGLEVRTPLNFKNHEDQQAFSDLKADIAVVVAYGLLLPKQILETPRLGCLNIHASLLPRWRGAAPIHRAIMAGDTQTGICIMQMEEGLDTGPVLRRDVVPIGPDVTTPALHNTLSTLGAHSLIQVLDALAGDGITPTPQTQDGVCYASKISKKEARIDWSQSAESIDRHIRALTPFPGAWTQINGLRVKILAAELHPNLNGTTGMVLDDVLTIACGNHGAIRPTQVQPAGKAAMLTDAFLCGTSVPPMTQLDVSPQPAA